jgi:hypothetical protein
MFGWFKRKKKAQEPALVDKTKERKRDPNPINTNRPSHFTESGYKRHMEDNWNDPLNPMLTTWAATTLMSQDDDTHRHSSSCNSSSSYSSSDSSSSYSSDSSSSYSSSCDSSSSSSDSSSF